jgi:hypothetical protein
MVVDVLAVREKAISRAKLAFLDEARKGDARRRLELSNG